MDMDYVSIGKWEGNKWLTSRKECFPWEISLPLFFHGGDFELPTLWLVTCLAVNQALAPCKVGSSAPLFLPFLRGKYENQCEDQLIPIWEMKWTEKERDLVGSSAERTMGDMGFLSWGQPPWKQDQPHQLTAGWGGGGAAS